MAKKIETLPATDNPALEHDPEARMIAERVMALKEETPWDLPVSRGKPLTGEALKAWQLKKVDQAAVGQVERGIGYALLKRELGHGGFEGWLKDNGIPLSSARADRQVAQLYLGLSTANRQRAVGLAQRKLQVLASAPPKMVEDLFDSGALDDAADMSRDQLREIIQLRKQVEKASAREARLEQVIAEQDETLRQHSALPEVQAHVLELRQAVIEETQSLRVNATQLQALMDRLDFLPRDLESAQRDAIAHPLMYALQGLQATVGAMLERGFNSFANLHADLDVFPPALEPGEIERARRLSIEFMQRAELRAVHREVDTVQPKAKRGRGRPRKGTK
jgi:DNA repair exonuclease SbcCD ATPase subunit